MVRTPKKNKPKVKTGIVYSSYGNFTVDLRDGRVTRREYDEHEITEEVRSDFDQITHFDLDICRRRIAEVSDEDVRNSEP